MSNTDTKQAVEYVQEKPARIVNLELSRAGAAKDGKPIINMYAARGDFRVLEVKARDFHLFAQGGYDIQKLKEGEIVACNLSMDWQLDFEKDGITPRLNGKKNQYKSAVSITNNAQQATADNSAQLDKIEAMLEYLIANITSNGDTAATPAPAVGSRIIVQGSTEQRAATLTRWGAVDFAAEIEGKVYKFPTANYIGAAEIA